MAFARGDVPATYWPTRSGQLHLEGSFRSNEVRLLAAAAVRGLGIAYLPEPLVHAALESGELVQVLEGILEVSNRVAIVYAEREFLPPQVRAFVEAVVNWMLRLEDALGPAKPGKPRAG